MKHASATTLVRLEPLLEQLRSCELLREKKPGIFYRTTAAFLHFHEDPAGIFADLKVGINYQRFRVNSQAEQRRFLTAAHRALDTR